MKLNKERLFRYYKFILSLEDILSIRVKKNIFADSFSYRLVEKIKQHFYLLKNKKTYFKLNSTMAPDKIVMPISNMCEFFESMMFLEKAKNYAQKHYNRRLNQDSLFESSSNFSFGVNNAYQYGIVVYFAKEKPYQNNSFFVPMVTIPLPSEDSAGEALNPGEIYEYTKKFLGMEYDREIDEKDIRNSVPIFNPSLLEAYDLKYKVFKSTSFDAIKKEIGGFFKENKIDTIPDDYIEKGVYFVAYSQKYTRGLLKIYETILKDGLKTNALLDEFFSVHLRKLGKAHSTPIAGENIYTSGRIFKTCFNHFGAYDLQNPLADTQRIAMSCYIDGNNKILPVNGAPGTGKTSLLRAIIGDYIVKSALETYETFRSKKIVEFPTPIVCSSTNNQALYNIYEGVDEAFSKHMKKMDNDILYTRWLNYKDDFFQDGDMTADIAEDDGSGDVEIEDTPENIDYHTHFFIPSIKSSRGKFYEMSKEDMLGVVGALEKETSYFEKCFLEHVNDSSYFKDEEKQYDRLIKIAQYFFEKLRMNILVVLKDSKCLSDIEKLSELEKELVKKYVKDENTDKYVKHSFRLYKTKRNEISSLLTAIESVSKNIDDLKKVRNTKQKPLLRLKADIADYSKSIEKSRLEIKKVESNVLDIKGQLKNPSSSKHYKNEYENISALILQGKKDILSKECIDMQNEVLNSSGGVAKLLFNLFNIGAGVKSRISDVKSLYDEKISNISSSKDYLDEVSSETAKRISLLIEPELAELENKLDVAKSKENEILKIQEDLISQRKNLEDEIEELERKLSEESKRLVKYQKTLKEYDLVFDDNELMRLNEASASIKKLEEIEEKYKEYDKSLRTENFYYALHLLEALFFVGRHNNTGRDKVLVCPSCKNGDMIEQTNDQNTMYCKSCGACLHSSQLTKYGLTKKDSEELIKTGIVFVDKKSYTLEINQGDGRVFLNIKDASSGGSDVFYRAIFPIFPVVNITCNSFGSVTQYKTDAGETKTLEDFFEFLLIDEAGTIPASKMVIMNSAKRVMLFGDVLQLKPVLPYDYNTEKEILKMFFDENDDILATGEYFSCASKPKELSKQIANNAMLIANNASMIFLPYDDSKLDGDIWLKEHFRCKDEIIAISNEISYENEIVQCSGVGGKLVFVESSGQKVDNMNEKEALLIVKYLIENIDDLCDFVGCESSELYKKIGIITPFLKQQLKIAELVGESGLGDIKVGTVHKFQGSEREIILFSTVYGSSSRNPQNFFFNREDPDMINVAVTRAKKMFVCFGNQRLLSSGDTYSAIMMRHILENGEIR